MKEMMNVHAAKTNFSKLLVRVANGEEIVIAKDGVPVAKLVPYGVESTSRPLGLYAGKIWLSDDALESPPWLLDAFEGIGGELPPLSSAPVAQPRRVAENVQKGAKPGRSRKP
ncbi:MAG: type II toxin-antitoxin system prevent-host-death family antitoxin [Gemmatimonadota bacterium]